MPKIDAERLRELMHYDPESGVFTWCVSTSHRVRASDVAGHIAGGGYRYIGIDGRTYRAHRLAWLYMAGEWPPHEIDHKDRDPSNNRLCNLRAATRSQNIANCSVRSDNTSGIKGVSWCKVKRKWRASIQVGQKPLHLGYRGTKEDAAALYATAAAKSFGEFSRTA